jgi:hypothetical protein
MNSKWSKSIKNWKSNTVGTEGWNFQSGSFFLRTSGSDCRDQSIVPGARSGINSLENAAEGYRWYSQSMWNWSRRYRPIEYEFADDCDAKQFQNWRRSEEWMQMEWFNCFWVHSCLKTSEVVTCHACHAGAPLVYVLLNCWMCGNCITFIISSWLRHKKTISPREPHTTISGSSWMKQWKQ